MKRIALTVLAVLATGAVPASADAATTKPRCAPAGSKVVLTGRDVQVYSRVTEAQAPGQTAAPIVGKRYEACLRRGDLRRRLADAPDCFPDDCEVHSFRARGTLVAWVFSAGGRGGSSDEVTVKNVATGRLLWDTSASGLVTLALTEGGRPVWTASPADGEPQVLYALRKGGYRVLDSGSGIDLRSLRADGANVSWLGHGVRRFAPIPHSVANEFRGRPVVTYTRTSGGTCCFQMVLRMKRPFPVDRAGHTHAAAKLADIFVPSLGRIGRRDRNCYTGYASTDFSKSRVVNNPRPGDSVVLRVIAAGTLAARRVGIAPDSETYDAQTRRSLRGLGCR